MQVLGVRGCLTYDRLCYNDRFLSEQVDCVRPGNNVFASANNDFQCEEDYFRHGNSYVAIKLYCFAAGLNRL